MTFSVGTGIKTVGTTSTPAFTQATHPLKYLRIMNPAASGGTSIAYSLDGTAAVINGGGCVTLAPGFFDEWKYNGPVPANVPNIIGSAGGAPVTIFFA